MNTNNRKKIATLVKMSVLIAIMLVLGYIEHMIPIALDVPGVKLGLSNGVLIFAIYMLNRPQAFLLMLLKVVLSGAMFGFSATPYALAGGILSVLVMALLSKIKGTHPVIVSMAGGVMHNVGQIGYAMLVLGTPQLLYYMALLMVVGLACGLLTGVCANSVIGHMKKIKTH